MIFINMNIKQKTLLWSEAQSRESIPYFFKMRKGASPNKKMKPEGRDNGATRGQVKRKMEAVAPSGPLLGTILLDCLTADPKKTGAVLQPQEH